ncbi:hypothetical protein JCM8097_001020 [Rhodosporidiobolus ruineniae]
MHRSPTPPPFLRRPSSASSSSFLSSTTYSEVSSDESSTETGSSDSDDETDNGYWDSSSGVSGDEGRFIRQLDLSIGSGGAGLASAPGGSTSLRSGSSSARANLKLSLAVLRARHSLAAQSYEALAGALKSLSAALPSLGSLAVPVSGENPLGVFVPILHRLAKDVKASLASEDKGREFRRKLGKEDAKALVALKQRWSGARKEDGKGKGKDAEQDWVAAVNELVVKNPPPTFISDTDYLNLTSSLLTSLESLLLPSSLPRLSLANLDLHDRDLLNWPALRRLPEVVEWNFSFVVVDEEEARRRARQALDGIRSLDLSKNKLTTLPFCFTRLFPRLETLSLSHNHFTHLPPWVTLFTSLRRLRTHGNRLVSSRKALKPLEKNGKKREKAYPRQAGTRANVRDVIRFVQERLAVLEKTELQPSTSSTGPTSLLSMATQAVQALLPSSSSSPSDDVLLSLPHHLQDVVSSSYNCASCARFVLSGSSLHTPPFWERVHHLDSGITLPSYRPPPAPAPSTSPSAFGTPPSPFASPFAERPATIEQRVLLALLARIDVRPPPPPRPIRRASSSTSLSSLASTSTTSNGPPRRRPTRRERDWEAGKAVLPTLVIGGDGDQGAGYRFCVPCAAAHLGLEAELAERGLGGWECRDPVCVEERRVREPAEPFSTASATVEGSALDDDAIARSKVKVMRWLRRRERSEKQPVTLGAVRIA